MRMRKGLVAAVVVGLAGALSAIGISSAATTVSIAPSKGIAPSKLPKTKFKAASLNVVVDSNTDTPEELPTAVTNTVLDFDDDAKITTTGLKTCGADLANTTTQQARNKCPKAIVGTGTAQAVIPAAPDPVTTNGVVTAFNGPKQGGNPTIILHVRTDVGITQVLTGVIRKINAGDYGTEAERYGAAPSRWRRPQPVRGDCQEAVEEPRQDLQLRHRPLPRRQQDPEHQEQHRTGHGAEPDPDGLAAVHGEDVGPEVAN